MEIFLSSTFNSTTEIKILNCVHIIKVHSQMLFLYSAVQLQTDSIAREIWSHMVVKLQE